MAEVLRLLLRFGSILHREERAETLAKFNAVVYGSGLPIRQLDALLTDAHFLQP